MIEFLLNFKCTRNLKSVEVNTSAKAYSPDSVNLEIQEKGASSISSEADITARVIHANCLSWLSQKLLTALTIKMRLTWHGLFSSIDLTWQ